MPNKSTESKPTLQKIPNTKNSQILQKIQKTTTQTKSQNISTPNITLVSSSINQNQTTTTQTTIQFKSQNMSKPQTTISNISKNNTGTGSYIQKTTETTKTITSTPFYSEQQNGEEFIQNFLNGQNQYNIGNTTATTTTYAQNNYNLSNINVNGQYENGVEIGYDTDSLGQINDYEIGGNANSNSITSNRQYLEPIINQVQVNSLYKNAIFNETNSKALVSENTLPVSYLPDKINDVIVDDKVTTLPIITTGNAITHNTVQLQPIIHDIKTYSSNENFNINDINNNNITDYNTTTNTNIIGNNYGSDYNFNTGENISYGGNFDSNGIIDNNIITNNNYNDINNIDNNWITTQTTETTTTQYNNNHSVPIVSSNYIGNEQI